jgi:hypothetical protein
VTRPAPKSRRSASTSVRQRDADRHFDHVLTVRPGRGAPRTASPLIDDARAVARGASSSGVLVADPETTDALRAEDATASLSPWHSDASWRSANWSPGSRSRPSPAADGHVCFVDTGCHDQPSVDDQFGKPGHAILAGQRRVDITLQRQPWQFRCPGDGAERKDEAIRDRRDEQGFWRPAVSRPAELRRWRGGDGARADCRTTRRLLRARLWLQRGNGAEGPASIVLQSIGILTDSRRSATRRTHRRSIALR